MDNIIKELKFQLGEKEVVLSMDEARKLKNALDELFGMEVVKEAPSPYFVYPWWQWMYPTITWTAKTGEA